jgi:hypothetical protein
MTKDVIRVHQDPCARRRRLERPAGPPEPAHPVHALGVPGGAACLGQRGAAHRLGAALRHGAPRGAVGGRHAGLPEEPFLRRIRVRLGLGRRLPRHGLRYYPKLLVRRALHAGAGQRLLATTTPPATRLLAGLAQVAEDEARRRCTCCSMSPTKPTGASPPQAGCCARACSSTGPGPGGPACRLRPPSGQPAARQAQEDPAGKRGAWPRPASPSPCTRARQIDAELWDFFHQCYTLTYRAHHSPRPT